jgi:phage antirepressor YoqD-like protein
VYYQLDENAARKGVSDEPFTVDLARRVVGDVIAHMERRSIVAPRSKKDAEDEIDDLVDDLDELDEEEDEDEEVEEVEEEDEEEDEDEEEAEEDEEEEEDDEEEDPDKAPKHGRSKGKAAAKREGIGTREVADELGIESRQLRMYLRSKGIQPRDDREGRYTWPSLKDKEVQRIIKDVRRGELAKMNKEKLDEMKGKAAKKSTDKKPAAKKTSAKKSTTHRKK